MSEDKVEQNKDDGARFDMYHFFSRKDVILAAIVILALLIYALFYFFTSGQAV